MEHTEILSVRMCRIDCSYQTCSNKLLVHVISRADRPGTNHLCWKFFAAVNDLVWEEETAPSSVFVFPAHLFFKLSTVTSVIQIGMDFKHFGLIALLNLHMYFSLSFVSPFAASLPVWICRGALHTAVRATKVPFSWGEEEEEDERENAKLSKIRTNAGSKTKNESQTKEQQSQKKRERNGQNSEKAENAQK